MCLKLQVFIVFQILCSFVKSNPFAGLLDPSCVVYPSGSCPNENVTFWLYTKETQEEPMKLNVLNLNPWDFQPRKPLKILIHGYTGDKNISPNSHIRPMLLQHEDVYVISVDYGPLVRYPCYFAAVQNLPVASKCLGQLINNLVEQGIVYNEDIHVIGFSLGAQVAGQTSNYVNQKLSRVTGLDPAKPMFITVDLNKKLDENDADFVDVIHTDILGRGMLRRMGHVDFYPNFGPYQPGCPEELSEDPGSCNHDRAPRYYAESIKSPQGFWSFGCPGWMQYLFGLCPHDFNQSLMGYHINKSITGSYFLKTSNKSPFAMGRSQLTINNSTLEGNHRTLLYYNVFDIDDDGFEPQLRTAFINFTDTELRSLMQSYNTINVKK